MFQPLYKGAIVCFHAIVSLALKNRKEFMLFGIF